jgi:hypothetical protein
MVGMSSRDSVVGGFWMELPGVGHWWGSTSGSAMAESLDRGYTRVFRGGFIPSVTWRVSSCSVCFAGVPLQESHGGGHLIRIHWRGAHGGVAVTGVLFVCALDGPHGGGLRPVSLARVPLAGIPCRDPLCSLLASFACLASAP